MVATKHNSDFARAEYRNLRREGWKAAEAWGAARIAASFGELAQEGLVDFEVIPDECISLGDLEGDMFAPEVHPDIHPDKLAARREEFVDRVNREGVYGIVSRWRESPEDEWKEAYSCWGFVGNDWRRSGYDFDAMHEAVRCVESSSAVAAESGLI